MTELEFLKANESTLNAAGRQRLAELESPDKEASAGLRLETAMKASKSGRRNYLEEKLGKENVFSMDNQTYLRDSPQEPWYPFNKPGFTARDLLDYAPDLAQAGPAMLAGAVTGSPLVAVGAGALGSLGRQAVSASMPGDDEMGLLGRAGNVAMEGALSGLAQKGSNLLFGVTDYARPHNIIARQMQKAQKTPFGQEGAAMNTPLTLGQETGSKGMLTLEGIARRHPASADIMQELDERQVEVALSRLHGIMNRIKPGEVGSEKAGSTITAAYRRAIDALKMQRQAAAKVDFALVDDVSGGGGVMQAPKLYQEILKIAEESRAPATGRPGMVAERQLQKMAEELLYEPENAAAGFKRLTGRELQNMLQQYSSGASGNRNFVGGLTPGQQRMIGTRLWKALEADMDSAITSPIKADVVAALKTARGNYKIASDKIDEVSGDVIGKMLGKVDPAPEAVAEKVLRLPSSQLRHTMGVIDNANAEAGQNIRRNALERMLANSEAPVQSGPMMGQQINAAGSTLSPSKFFNEFRKNRDRLRVMFPKDYDEILGTTAYISRLANRAGTDGSPTTPLAAAFKMITDVLYGVTALQPKVVMESTGQVFAMRHFAKAVTTPEGRAALLSIKATGKPTKGMAAGIAYLSSLVARDPGVSASEEQQ